MRGGPVPPRMGIPVEVPGLDTILPTVDEGRLLVVESGTDSAKSFFIRRVARTAIAHKWPVTFVISRDQAELTSLLAAESGGTEFGPSELRIEERDSFSELNGHGAGGGLLAIDSFSFLTLDLDSTKVSALLRSMRTLAREHRTTIILATDRGMFEARAEAVAMHLADGVIQFHAKEGPEGMVRYLRVPKWSDGRFVDRNVYYDFDGRRIAIDLRSRVL